MNCSKRRLEARRVVTDITAKKPEVVPKTIQIRPDPMSDLHPGEYRIDVDHYGRVRAAFILERLIPPFNSVLVLNKKILKLYPNAEFVQLKRCRCDDGTKYSWWVAKWDMERVVLVKQLYRKSKNHGREKITERF